MKPTLLVAVLVAVAVPGMLPSASSVEMSTAPSWGSAQLIETFDEGEACYPEVAMNSQGNSVAVWQQYDGVHWSIWSSTYVVNVGWGAAQVIETFTSGNATEPVVAMDDSGNAIAAWIEYDGVWVNISANRYLAGTGWTGAELIETSSGDAWFPEIVMDSAGNAIAVWCQHDGVRYNIWSNRYVVGTGWTGAELVETDSGEAYSLPRVDMDGGGNAIAVWYQNDGTRTNIWSNRYVVGTGWTGAELIETGSGRALDPRLSVDSAGNAVAVWYQDDGIRFSIYSNRYVEGNGWIGEQLIENVDVGDFTYPDVVANDTGDAVAVWYQFTDNHYNGWSNRYVVGTGWTGAELVETGLGDVSYLQAAIDSSGNTLAVWIQDDGTSNNVLSSRYVVGSGWDATPQIIGEVTVGNPMRCQLAMNGAGNAVAVWDQTNVDRRDVWSNRYSVPATTPTSPRSLQTTPGDGFVQLDWQTPSSDGGLPIIAYNVYRGNSSNNITYYRHLGVSVSYNDTGLTNGVTYYYQVTANNSAGESPRSSKVSATPTGTSGPALNVVIGADPDSGSVPLEVSFTCSVTGGVGPYTYLWDFKDGGTSTQQNPEHTYDSAGTYNVSVIVADSAGNSTQKTIEVEVAAGGSTAWLPIAAGGVIVAAIVVGAVIWALMRRRGKAVPAAPTPGEHEPPPPTG